MREDEPPSTNCSLVTGAKSHHWVIQHMISPGWPDARLLQAWNFLHRKGFTVSGPQTLQCPLREDLVWYERVLSSTSPLVERLWCV